MKLSGIYGIFNTANGKILVGSTVNLHKRWISHRNDARNGTHHNPHFQAAWNQDGENAFEFRVIEECPINVLVPREDYWMAFYRSLDRKHGYNCQNATQTIVCEETRTKMSQAAKGKIISDSTRKKMSLAHSGSNHPMFGKHHTEESKKKMSLHNLGRKPSEATRKKLSECRRGVCHWLYGKHHTKDTRRKISLSLLGHVPSNKGKPASDTHKKNLRDAWIQRKKNGKGGAWNKGKPMSEETKRKLSVLTRSYFQKKRESSLIPLPMAVGQSSQVFVEVNSPGAPAKSIPVQGASQGQKQVVAPVTA